MPRVNPDPTLDAMFGPYTGCEHVARQATVMVPDREQVCTRCANFADGQCMSYALYDYDMAEMGAPNMPPKAVALGKAISRWRESAAANPDEPLVGPCPGWDRSPERVDLIPALARRPE